MKEALYSQLFLTGDHPTYFPIIKKMHFGSHGKVDALVIPHYVWKRRRADPAFCTEVFRKEFTNLFYHLLTESPNSYSLAQDLTKKLQIRLYDSHVEEQPDAPYSANTWLTNFICIPLPKNSLERKKIKNYLLGKLFNISGKKRKTAFTYEEPILSTYGDTEVISWVSKYRSKKRRNRNTRSTKEIKIYIRNNIDHPQKVITSLFNDWLQVPRTDEVVSILYNKLLSLLCKYVRGSYKKIYRRVGKLIVEEFGNKLFLLVTNDTGDFPVPLTARIVSTGKVPKILIPVKNFEENNAVFGFSFHLGENRFSVRMGIYPKECVHENTKEIRSSILSLL